MTTIVLPQRRGAGSPPVQGAWDWPALGERIALVLHQRRGATPHALAILVLEAVREWHARGPRPAR